MHAKSTIITLINLSLSLSLFDNSLSMNQRKTLFHFNYIVWSIPVYYYSVFPRAFFRSQVRCTFIWYAGRQQRSGQQGNDRVHAKSGTVAAGGGGDKHRPIRGVLANLHQRIPRSHVLHRQWRGQDLWIKFTAEQIRSFYKLCTCYSLEFHPAE